MAARKMPLPFARKGDSFETMVARMSEYLVHLVTQGGSADAIVDLLAGKVAGGSSLAAYVAIRRGLVPQWNTNGTGALSTFGAMCLAFDRLDVLIAVAEAGWPEAAGKEAERSTAEWLDELCSWDINFAVPDGVPMVQQWSLIQAAVDPIQPNSRAALAYAISVAPEHPAIATLSAVQSEAGALMREVAMQRRIAASGHGCEVPPAAPAKRRAQL